MHYHAHKYYVHDGRPDWNFSYFYHRLSERRMPLGIMGLPLRAVVLEAIGIILS